MSCFINREKDISFTTVFWDSGYQLEYDGHPQQNRRNPACDVRKIKLMIKEELLQKGENQHVEFKTSFNDEVIISLVAFSNARGGAVYIGVTDDGTVKGVSLGKETVAQWINDIKNKTAPVLIPDVETVVVETQTVVVLSVSEYPIKPVSFKGRYYKRVENANQLLTTTEVVNLHLQTLNTSWDAYYDAVHTLDDISLEKVQSVIEIMKENGLTINETPIAFLQKYDLLREGKLTLP